MKPAAASRRRAPSVEIVTIGTELLLGQLVDTNSATIARAMADSGVDVYAKHSVGDNAARLEAMLRGVLDRADGAITTGGLGPTVDDLTKEAISAAVDGPLREHGPSVLAIEARMASFGRSGPLSPNNRRQAFLPQDAVVLDNPHGTAPGFVAVRADGKFIAAMPGVPREMAPMLAEKLVPWLVARYGLRDAIFTRTLHTAGIGESDLDARIEPLFRTLENPKIAVLAHDFRVDVKIMAKAADADAAAKLTAPVEAELRERLGPSIFGTDDDTLASVVLARCRERGLTLATAESITGGAVADALVRVPGASRVFRGAIVAYDDEVKRALLDVDEALLRQHGAVSEAVAGAMASGACARLDADVAVATTGIAGPGGATPSKPVGLVYLAVVVSGREPAVRRLTSPGNRDDIRRRAMVAALALLLRELTIEAAH
ncbi:MAG: competence/damage-inducible protein A [Candidatus Eremiobacteraeota bacterium]|nr:competence/damage-inducible protein A [Candidatus Eremiobacteraeota bacterium]MBC5821771.1 competence/damage-inducible protein A [Candidatus Eremiobacteraeota bacterium]